MENGERKLIFPFSSILVNRRSRANFDFSFFLRIFIYEKKNYALTFSKFKFGSRRIEIDLQIVEWGKECNRYFRYQETISTTSG